MKEKVEPFKEYRLRTNYNGMSDKKLLLFSSNLILSLDGNPNFPGLQKFMKQLKGLHQAYDDANVPKPERSEKTATHKTNCRNALCQLISKLRGGVIFAADNDFLVLQTSGFDMFSKKGKSKKPAVPSIKSNSSTTVVGQMEVVAKKGSTTRVDSYIFKLKHFDGTPVAVNSSNNTKTLLDNVPLNTPLLLSVQAKNAAGVSGFSEPVIVRLMISDDNYLAQIQQE